jgi:hypothetical protein
MKELIKKIEDIIDREVENNHLKTELNQLSKMLKLGFENSTNGYDKIPKLFATADEKKLKKFYDIFGNQIKAMHVSGDYKQFSEYMKINHGIEFVVSDKFPNMSYTKNPKKKDKFYNLYSSYFIADTPKDAKEALDQITKSIGNIFKEFKKEEEPIKDDMKLLIESDENSKLCINTLAKIVKTSKMKDETMVEVAGAAEDKLNEQLKAIDMIEA